MAAILPNGKNQFIDANGRPLIGGKVYFYEPNTETLKDTWADAAMTQVNTNPVTLDARGQAPIHGNGSYRQVLKDRFLNTVWDEVIDAPLTDDDLPSGGVGRPQNPKLWQIFIDSSLGPYGQPIYCAQVNPVVWCNFAGVKV
ncbi:hypothetical protein [Burkholderia lata]|uniref:hypothetical protein n=1 Tax=Burkholderia lata (strain ATCC 17760 / DSM 23089 / LMG 22485 / NCIMB 9086 / R18194 / 383) TaxID=482957 RepID=UPI0015821FF2|nr:hypothetical protein [Burkholderia lata]